MNQWMWAEVIVNVTFFMALIVIWIRLSRPAKDDPRLSRGLQLLQSKIAVLEDLSDRTEILVNQLTTILEKKSVELETKFQQADEHVQKVNASMEKSLEIARIFQDKIPHEEIIERKNTLRFIKAAKLANQGKSAEEIQKEVQVSQSEADFISKINRENLSFNESNTPEWAKPEITD